MPEPAQLPGYPLLRLGVEGGAKLKQRCQRSSEFRCARRLDHHAVRRPLLRSPTPSPKTAFSHFPTVHRVDPKVAFGSRLCENVGWVRILMD
jgi:hypothetical protein